MTSLSANTRLSGSIRHYGPIAGVASSGNLVATAGYDSRVVMWNAPTRTAIAMGMHDHLVNYVSFSPDGRHVVTASSDYSARVWRSHDLSLQRVLIGHEDDVDVAMFSPNGEFIATSSHDHTIRIWSFESGHQVCTLRGHTGDVLALAWEADSQTIVSSSDDGSVRRWSTTRGEEVNRLSVSRSQCDALALVGAGCLVAGDDNGEIYLSTVDGEQLSSVKAHQAGIKFLRYHSASDSILCLAYDGRVSLWKVLENELTPSGDFKIPPQVWPRSCALQENGIVVFGTFGSAYARLDTATGAWDLEGIESDCSLNAVAVDGSKLYSVGDAGAVECDGKQVSLLGKLCNFILPAGKALLTGGQTGEVLDAFTQAVIHRHSSPLNCAVRFVSQGQDYVVIGTYTGELLRFAIRDGALEFDRVAKVHENAVKGVAAGHDLIFSCCADGSVAVSDAFTLDTVELVRRGHTSIANGCVATAHGFASVGRDLRLRTWLPDLSSEEIVTPHVNSIRCVSVAHRGRVLATGGYRGLIALYDLYKGQWIKTLRPSSYGISSICSNASDNGFFAASYDGVIHEVLC